MRWLLGEKKLVFGCVWWDLLPFGVPVFRFWGKVATEPQNLLSCWLMRHQPPKCWFWTHPWAAKSWRYLDPDSWGMQKVQNSGAWSLDSRSGLALDSLVGLTGFWLTLDSNSSCAAISSQADKLLSDSLLVYAKEPYWTFYKWRKVQKAPVLGELTPHDLGMLGCSLTAQRNERWLLQWVQLCYPRKWRETILSTWSLGNLYPHDWESMAWVTAHHKSRIT